MNPSTRPKQALKITAVPLLPLLLLAIGDAAATENKVYVSHESGQLIQRMNLDGSNVENVVTGEIIRAMDVDPIGRKIYWFAPGTLGGQYIMRRSDLDGTNAETVWPDQDTHFIFRIDPHNAKIYYNKNAADRIWRANLDGSGSEPLVHAFDADPQPSPRSMAMDIRNDRLYWTNFSPAVIQYTNLAGTDPIVTVAAGSLSSSGIEVDPAGGKLYWKNNDGLWSADLDAGNQTLLVPAPEGQGSGGNNNLRLDHDNGYLYWSQQNVSKIWRCQLPGCAPQQIGSLTDTRYLALLLPCYDPFQIDSEGDGVFDLCDNCVAAFNPGQGDLDSDGEGDACDLDDGEIALWFEGPGGAAATLSWDTEFGPFWNVYRADLATIKNTGVYTQVPGSHPAADRFCDETSPALQDGYGPGPGDVAAYLVTGYDAGLETELDVGLTSRPNHNPCP